MHHFIRKLALPLHVKTHRKFFWKVNCSQLSNGNKNKLHHELNYQNKIERLLQLYPEDCKYKLTRSKLITRKEKLWDIVRSHIFPNSTHLAQGHQQLVKKHLPQWNWTFRLRYPQKKLNTSQATHKIVNLTQKLQKIRTQTRNKPSYTMKIWTTRTTINNYDCNYLFKSLRYIYNRLKITGHFSNV